MEPIKSPTPPQGPPKNISTYIGIIVLTIVITALGAVAISSVLRDSPEVPADEGSRSGDTSMPEGLLQKERSPLDETPFDPSNPNLNDQIESIEAELGELDTDLLEEELSDEQLGIE